MRVFESTIFLEVSSKRLDMRAFKLRNFITSGFLILFPALLLAEGPASAIIHSKGGVWVNGAEVADASTIFAGDSIETKAGFVANLDSEGSSVLIQGESIVKFEGSYLVLEHGSVAVGTSTSMSVHVNCIHVDPVTTDRTQYEVTDVSGKVEVAARKKDVVIRGGTRGIKSTEEGSSQSATVHESEQATRDESVLCGAPERPISPSHGLNTKWLEIGGGGGGGALILCLLLCKGSPPSSVSPSQP